MLTPPTLPSGSLCPALLPGSAHDNSFTPPLSTFLANVFPSIPLKVIEIVEDPAFKDEEFWTVLFGVTLAQSHVVCLRDTKDGGKPLS